MSDITFGLETVFSAGQRKTLWASVFFFLGLLDLWKVAEVVITTGKKRKKWFMAKSDRNEKEEEDHEKQYFLFDRIYELTAQSAAGLPSLPCQCPSTSSSTCRHFTQLKPLCSPAALPRALHYAPTSSRPALPPCAGLPGVGPFEGRCLLQLVMRSAASASQWLLLFTVADEVTSGVCRLIQETKTRK